MQQQINLYKLLPQKPKSVLTRRKIFLAYAVFFLLLMGQWINALWQKHLLNKEYQQEVALLAETQNRFKKLIGNYPTVDTKNIQTIGESLRAELAKELKILSLLTESSKFSTYMQGLAEASVPNVWLTTINFSAKEPHIVLKGNTLQPQYAQQFLDQLTHQVAFVDLPFKISDLAEGTIDKTPVFTFNMTTKTKSPK